MVSKPGMTEILNSFLGAMCGECKRMWDFGNRTILSCFYIYYMKLKSVYVELESAGMKAYFQAKEAACAHELVSKIRV